MSVLASFLKFLSLDENTKTSNITKSKESKESTTQKALPKDPEEKENIDSIPLEKTTTKIVTESIGNLIIEKEIITKEVCNGESIQTTTKTNITKTFFI